LRKVSREVVVDSKFAGDALWGCEHVVGDIELHVSTYTLRFEMSASQAVVVLIEIHHLEAIELV
jgi:hypothetical protein